MALGWIKHALLPRGLYGRAALILIIPVIGLQLVVSIVFLQRHFEGVTEQMTRSIALDLSLVANEYTTNGLAAAEALAVPLDFVIAPGTRPDWTADTSGRRRFGDLSGRAVISTLDRVLPEVQWVDLTRTRPDRFVMLNVSKDDGPGVDITFRRQRVSASNPHQLLVLMVASGLLMTAVAYIFLRNQLRPIRRLARAAEAFGRGQSVEYHPSGAIEVRSAGLAFLDMRARIERAIEERTRMLSGVSHDLRTPLTRMRLALSMQDQGPETADLTRDVEEMQGLVNAFLDFARGAAQDPPEPTDAVTLARQVVDDARRGAGNVTFDGPEKGEEVPLRAADIRRALSNLIANALRYGDRAQVSVAVTEKSLRLSVEDDGPGIPEHARARAVEPFTRLDEARNQDQGSGVGLGLAIVNDIARRHGGTLRLSDSLDLGGLRADLILPR